jgi:voltage-gated potassium channel
VGYGDIYPQTSEGRLIAVVLMLTGIGVIGMFTATIANFFMVEQGESEIADVRSRLERIEDKLDRLLTEDEAQSTRPLVPSDEHEVV